MGLKLKIIMNPSSGRETARVNVDDMLAYLVSFGALERADAYYTSARFDAVRFAKETDVSSYDYMIAVGGDGTVNEVITGMMEGGIDLPLAIYTSGTVNDFATINGLPSLPSDFARMLMNPSFNKVDCGKVNDKYFLNVLAGGLMADVAYKVPSDLKTAFGPAAYWMSAMKDIPSTINNAIHLNIETESESYEEQAIMFLISNTKSVGGFRKLMIGEHIYNDNVLYLQTDKLKLSTPSEEKVILDIDGEQGPSLPVNVECIHEAITLIVPGEEESL